ncbi:hypothetical protein FHG87_013113 [Trinorchestia longiramus]|nr:hypothetical protein FHG87_013113 [Trinorchestia longiramus]
MEKKRFLELLSIVSLGIEPRSISLCWRDRKHIQLLRTLCKKLTRALNAQRPYVVEFSGHGGARRLSYDSSSDSRYDTNSLGDSADVEARHPPRSDDNTLNPIWTDSSHRENDRTNCNRSTGNDGSSASVQNGSGCSSGGGGNIDGSISGTSDGGCGHSGKAMQTAFSKQSPKANCSELNNVREKNNRNTTEKRCEIAKEDDLTMTNIWVADDGHSSMRQSRSLGRKIRGKTIMDTGRENVEDIRALELIQYTESPRVPGRKRNLNLLYVNNKEISSSGYSADIPSLTVTDGDSSVFLSCLETVSFEENTNIQFLSPPRTPYPCIQDEVYNNESLGESLNYLSMEYEFSQPTFVERRNDQQTQIADKIPLNLFDCDRVVPSKGRHYPFRHEVVTQLARSSAGLNHCPGLLRPGEPINFESHRMVTNSFKYSPDFGSANHKRTRSASVIGGLSDECLQNLRSAPDVSSQSTVVELFNLSALDGLLISCPTKADHECSFRQGNASLASTLVSREVREAWNDNYNNPDLVPHNLRRLGPQHRYLSLDVNNLSEDPPEYNELPPPTYIEAMLNDHLQKQKIILEKRKASGLAIVNHK